MAGMLIQCSIQEGVVKNLQESQVKALQGNQLQASASYKNAVMYRLIPGLYNPFYYYYNQVGSFYTSSAATPFEWVRDYMVPMYELTSDVYTNGVSSYSATSSLSGSGHCPVVSGYPSGFDGSGNPTGTGTIWGAMAPIAYGTIFTNTFAVDYIDYKQSGIVKMTQNLSNAVDFASYFSKLKSDIFGQTWDWSVTEWTKTYNSPNIVNGQNISGLNPASYDDSIQSGSALSSYLPFSRSAAAQTGWSFLYPKTMVYSSGLAKNTTNVTQSYFIARYQGVVGFIGSSPNAFPSGVTYTTYVLTLVSSGVIQPNQVIGYGQDIDLPIPSTDAYPLNDLGNSPMSRDFYVAVIGKDPTAWAASVGGLSFGTHTAIT